MPQHEVYGQRDLSYSAWHRAKSTQRYVGIELAGLLSMIDLDASLWVEYDEDTKVPLALIETAIDKGQQFKPTTVTLNLAVRAGLPCYTLLYKLSEKKNPANLNYQDIEQFRVKRLNPNPEREWTIVTPEQWAQNLLKLRKWAAAKLDREIEKERQTA
jgi:hypothetical protein